MVLINNLTIDEINAALLHLQRSSGEIVGGDKGRTVNNISVSNSGGGGIDYQSVINSLKERLSQVETTNTEQQTQINEILLTLVNLADNGIQDFDYDENSGELTITTKDGEEYTVVIRSPTSTLTFDATTKKLTFTFNNDITEITLPYVASSEKGVANGVATLDSTGRIPYSQMPESAMEFKGEWNANTNTPHLQDGTGTNGDFYVCTVGGTVNFGTGGVTRNITFYPNDRVIYEGTSQQWFRLPAGEVRTVNGQSGDVVLDGEDINYSSASGSPTLKDKIDTVEGYAKTQSDWGQSNTSAIDYIKNKPNLATVATSGSYNDLSNKPTIPAAQIQSDWTQTDSTKKDFIKNKIPIWITSGSADDNMSPINSVTSGNTRPVTSGAVYNAINPVANATNADTVDGYHANVSSASNLIRVTKASDVGSGANGYYAGMANFNAGDGAVKWWHILSMDWSGNDANNWQSQFILPTQQGGVPKYRRNTAGGTSIANSSWHNFYTDENRQAIFDFVHPVGEIYVQYPGSKTPAAIYNITNVITSTWTEQTYSGAFFRASGGNADAFITGTTYTKQAQKTAVNGLSVAYTTNLNGTIGESGGNGFYGSRSAGPSTGVISCNEYGTNSFGGTGSRGRYSISIDVDHKHSLTGDTETRPENLTIRIWKRTA